MWRWVAAYNAAEARDGHIAMQRHWRATWACLRVAILTTLRWSR